MPTPWLPVSILAAGAPLAVGVSVGLVLLLGLATLLAARRRARHEVVAVRPDPDFGRIALLDDGRWEGAVPLAGLPRPVDVEIEARGEGPTLAQRLAYQDACADLQELIPSLAEACDRSPERFEEEARFLRLRLPGGGGEDASDWELSYALGEDLDAECFEVRVRAGRALGVRPAD